jgi:hypothetical protein
VGMPVKTVKDLLVILLQRGLTTYALWPEKGRDWLFYEMNLKNIFLIERYPNYIQLTNELFGDTVYLF